jgi:hypothetical protein
MQYSGCYAEMAFYSSYGVKAISPSEYQTMLLAVPGCVDAIKECQTNTTACAPARQACDNSQLGTRALREATPAPESVRCRWSVQSCALLL